MPRSRTTAAVLLSLAMAAPLTACSVGNTTAGGGRNAQEITFLTFETPNLTPKYWDDAIKRVTAQYPDITVKKLVSPSADRTAYAKQLRASGQLPDVMIAVSPSGFAEAGDLYAWQPSELKDFVVPDGGAIGGKVYQLPPTPRPSPTSTTASRCSPRPASPPRRRPTPNSSRTAPS
ncbi:hypothetical protein [Peterkaempfera sp. SMS 1(5)a]|uniref:hypothetical protein n=1 Tax=Peterkaempfera podocarpi TaxID=3232308 RepID=UPI00366BD055